MFKCKQCGHQFGANPPDQCPACGAVNEQPIQSARGLSILLALDTLWTLAFLIVVGLIIAAIVNWI